MAIDTRNCFWFGTEDYMDWFTTPLRGGDSSPEGWGASGTLLNGGGYGIHSWGTHKTYTYEWPSTSSPETAQRMKSYRDGTYGRGLLYFIDPTTFRTNVLPAAWASPSMAVDNEAPSLVYGVTPTSVATSNFAANGLPVQSAFYNVTTAAQTNADADTSVFIPIPTGMTLHVGAFYTRTGTAGVYATPINLNGTAGTRVQITAQANSATTMVTNSFTGIKGIRLWVGRTSAVASTITIAAMIARLVETGKPAPTQGPWIGGQGHSGCRFNPSSPPSYVTNGPINGGQIGFAASFIEVGSWAFG